MFVTFGIGKLPDGKIRLEVRRPQHHARAERSYSSVSEVRRVLSEFGIPEQSVEHLLKLLPDIESNGTLNFPPLEIPHHQLAEEGLSLESRQEDS